jgi:AmmeMemoRadiSam system protein B
VSTARPPAVAGMFYPDDPDVLTAMIDGMLDQVAGKGGLPGGHAAYVVPHAGYRDSGPTAAHVYARLRQHAADVRRIVVVGPAHRFRLEGAAVPAAERWLTPLGEVELDRPLAERLAETGLATMSDEPHAPEHSLEVQIPLLQRVHLERDLPKILPICVGRSAPERTAELIEAAAGADATVLCSTDLSHYLPDAQAREKDDSTVGAIVDLAPERIALDDACGAFALRGLLHWARAKGYTAEVLDRTTSADTGGTADRVVGYCAVALGRDAA